LIGAVRAVEYKPLTAEALALAGLIYMRAHNAAAAERLLSESYVLADASRNDDVRAEVATNLVFVVGALQGRIREASLWSESASAVLQRLGGHELLRSWLLNNLGCAELKRDGAAAVTYLSQAVATKTRILGTDAVDVALSEANLGIVLQHVHRYDESLTHIDKALAIFSRKVGAQHPDVASHLSDRGDTLNALGRYPEARQSFEQALKIWERNLDPDVTVADALSGLGLSYLGESRPANAAVVLERALRIREANNIPPAEVAQTKFALARALWDSGQDRARACRLAIEARSLFAKATLTPNAGQVDDWLVSHRAS
jgi:tetratricopeptide (TPR) repeat protein